MQPSIDFSDTGVAFAHKSFTDLTQSYILFKAFQNRLFSSVGPKMAERALAIGLPIQGLVKGTVFRQFCGGETLKECQKTVKRLYQHGVATILDYSVEGVKSESGFDDAAAEVSRTIKFAKEEPGIRFAVFKMTALARFSLLEKLGAGESLVVAEQTEWNLAKGRVEKLCSEANLAGLAIMLDAEESWIDEPIAELAFAMMKRFNKDHAVVYNTVQLYKKDGLTYLKNLHTRARAAGIKIGVKLVRGAYLEKETRRAKDRGVETPLQPSKQACDRDFDLALRYCLDNIDDIALCCGSHNEQSTALLTRLMDEKGLLPDDPRVEFSQLLGMSDHLTFNLAHHGYRVSKYVPYGPVDAVFPYLMRRAQENSSIRGQTHRELDLLSQELRRRRRRTIQGVGRVARTR